MINKIIKLQNFSVQFLRVEIAIHYDINEMYKKNAEFGNDLLKWKCNEKEGVNKGHNMS